VTSFPQIIQGGMGVAISNWKLARAVSRLGQLGVVSGTAIETILARRLQLGDPGGVVRRALAHFPVPAVADVIRFLLDPT
jgi:NAD(P)H-dependent flavin oxidoreductase YrpB (nitropropane dioxygenase family)